MKNNVADSRKTNFLGKLSEIFVNRHRISYLIILLISIVGIYGYLTLPRESMPNVSMPSATINTSYPGASPQDIEKLITDKIENKLMEMEDISKITSNSFLGYSEVNVTFNSSSNVQMKKILLNNKISEIKLPASSSKPEVSFMSTSAIPVIRINISGKYDMYSLTNISKEIKNEIEKVKGVSNVKLEGGVNRKFYININPLTLKKYDVSVSDIKEALNNSNISMPLGSKNIEGMYQNIRIDESFKNITDIENIIISTASGKMIKLNEITDIMDSSERPESIAGLYNNMDDNNPKTLSTINISVFRNKNSDVVGISNKIKQIININKGVLYSDDIKVSISYDQATQVKEDLADVTNNILSGLAVVTIVLFIFIGFSESIIVAFVIPLVMCSTLGIMKYLGITLNSLSILGLIVSLGLLVDNAIVIMESIDKYRLKGLSNIEASIIGTNQVAISVFAATLTTVVAFIPLALLKGVIGQFLKVIPSIVIITILVSFAVSLVITPTLCSRFLSKSKENIHISKFKKISIVVLIIILSLYAFRIEGRITMLTIIATIIFGGAMAIKQYKFGHRNLEDSNFIKWYSEKLNSIIHSKKKIMVLIISSILILSFSVSMFFQGYLKVGLFPESEAKSISISIVTNVGSTIENTSKVTTEIENILYDIPEIKNFNVSIGGNEKNKSSISAKLKDKSHRVKSGKQIITEIREKVKKIPGSKIEVVSEESEVGSSYPININIIGLNLEDVSSVAEIYKEKLLNIKGVETVKLSSGNGIPQIVFDIDRNKAKALGLSIDTIANELRMFISGTNVTNVRIDNNDIDVELRIDNKNISTISKLDNLLITNSNGDKIPVNNVAEIKYVKSLSQITHLDTKRVITVQSNLLSGYNAIDIQKELKKELQTINIPKSIEVKYSGETENIEKNFKSLAFGMLFAIVMVYSILAVQFNSMMQPFVILMTVPMALIGVVWGLIFTGNDFGLYGFMGLVSLVGIAVNDAIVLVDSINYLRSKGMNIYDSIVEAGKTRFIPVITTTLTTCGGILPLALKNPYYAQLGYSLIYGLLVATVMTLIFIPILYLLVEKKSIKRY